MRALNYLLYYGFIIPLSLLPFRVLYIISDGLYFLFYYVIRYRKEVVVTNIKNSFPTKTDEEIEFITKRFYAHFCDLVLESLKIFTISEKDAKKRMCFKNPELLNRFAQQHKSVIIMGGHSNNWEMLAVTVAGAMKHKAQAIYKPLSSLFFDKRMRATRGKFGLNMISTKKVKEYFEKEKGNLSATIFGIDQSPGNPEKCYWTTFLNQDTGVLFGAEKFAKEYNYAVVYGRINKESRGYYSFEFLDITDSPQQTNHGEITEKATRMIETDIIANPQYWLWTHKRWKHKRPKTVGSN